MPEEINRKVTDSPSDLCFVTSPEGIAHLGHEGIAEDRIHFVAPSIRNRRVGLTHTYPTL